MNFGMLSYLRPYGDFHGKIVCCGWHRLFVRDSFMKFLKILLYTFKNTQEIAFNIDLQNGILLAEHIL